MDLGARATERDEAPPTALKAVESLIEEYEQKQDSH